VTRSWPLLALAALVAAPPAASAEAARLTPSTERLDLGRLASVLVDPGCSLRIDEVAALQAAGRFRPVARERPLGFTSACAWLRVAVWNDVPEPRTWALGWRHPLVDHLDLYLESGTGVREVRGGLAVPPEARGFVHRGPIHSARASWEAGETVTVYLRVQTRASVLVGLDAWAPEALARHERRLTLALGAGLGALLVLALFSLYSFLALRDRSYLWFCLLLVSAGLYQLAESGVAAAWLWPGAHAWSMASPALLASAFVATGLAFARQFLGVRRLSPRLDEAGLLLALATLAAGVAGLANLRFANVAVAVAGAAAALLAVAWAGMAVAAGNRAARFFLAAAGVLVLFGLPFVLALLGVLPPAVASTGGIQAGFVVGAVIFTFALADRVQILHRLTRGQLVAEVAARTRSLEETVGALRGEAEERRRAEVARSETEERFRLAFKTSPDAIAIQRLDDGSLVAVNDGFTAVTGWAEGEVLGRPIHEFGLGLPEHRERMLGALAERGQVRNLEMRFQRRDGSWRDALLSASLHSVDGQPLVLSILRDVTEQRRAEAERGRLEDELRRAQKMEAIGRLAGGVAHDFNNLLTVISTNVALALLDTDAADPRREQLGEIQDTVQRAARLTRQLLAFGRKQLLEPRPLALGAVVEEGQKMLSRLVGEDVDLALDLAPGLPPVVADPAQVEQVLVNLVVNSRDALPRGGRITISTRQDEVAAGAATEERRPGRYVVLSVRDTGAGMDAETLRHVFEPFFTTKPEGKGTGLGLSTVYGIARQHGGFVEAESAPGRGTCFSVWFPLGEPQAGVPGTAPAPEPPALPGGSETVLLAEDEPGLREATRALLRRLGYRVHAAGDGPEAIDLADRVGGVDLLVTDVVMPRMNGRELAAALHARWPSLPVLFLSGYPSDAFASREILEEGLHFLAKPWTPAAFARKLRELLGGSPPAGARG
jgi:PAS domain S-box-containing protein